MSIYANAVRLHLSRLHLIEPIADRLKADPLALVAVLAVECGSSTGLGKHGPVVRFETHIFKRYVSAMVWQKYFKCHVSQPWRDQYFRWDVNEAWRAVHVDQGSEYLALDLAATIAPEAAHRSASHGIAQIMGFHFERLGYPDALTMHSAYKSEATQLSDFGTFIETSTDNGVILLGALRAKDWPSFGRGYNGPGKAKAYGERLSEAYRLACHGAG